eukprot:TRINITY_DN3377_c1_g3_i2.p1 TRINITY_DN3377_c1_g3~~TRINITY_DN3377_c1_g3_i2.p1  ORF type:complete len:291 (+),score=75.05 TRINITY_DN3377_c1_g3_i2:299-1171(+)
MKLDDQRYVDLSDPPNFLQRRYDDPDKRRAVRRLLKRSAGAAPGAPSAKRARTAGGAAASGDIDIVFSFDTTGSMMAALTEVRKRVSETVERLMKDLPTLKVGIVTHGDYCDGPSKLMTYMDLSRNTREIVKFVNSAPSTGGGDAPEAYEYVLQEAQNLSWTPGSTRTLVMIGDAAPHTGAETLKQMKQYKIAGARKIDWKDEVAKLQAMDIKIHGVRCGGSTEAFYEKIAATTGGKCVNLSDFALVVDMLLAMCFKEAGGHYYEAFKKEIGDAGRLDARYTTMFGEIES